MVLVYRSSQVLGVAHGGYHVVSPVGQDLGEARPDDCGVFGDHDAHCGLRFGQAREGSSTATTVGPPAGLVTLQPAIDGLDSLCEPGQAAAGLDPGAAGAVVADPDPDQAGLVRLLPA